MAEGMHDTTGSLSVETEPLTVKREVPKKEYSPEWQLSKEQIDDFYEAFEMFDTESKGWIDLAGLRVAIRALGFEPSAAEMKKYKEICNYNETKRISFDDFVEVLKLKMSEPDTIDDLTRAFSLIDEQGTGMIDIHDLERVAETISEEINLEQLAEMINAADSDGDGRVTLADFLAFMPQIPLRNSP